MEIHTDQKSAWGKFEASRSLQLIACGIKEEGL